MNIMSFYCKTHFHGGIDLESLELMVAQFFHNFAPHRQVLCKGA